MRRAVIAFFIVAGCGGGNGSSDLASPPDMTSTNVPVPQSFEEINAQILQPGCAGFSTCHSVTGARQAGGLDLKTDPYEALLNVVSTNTQAAEQNMMRVKPCNADKSFLVIKLELPETDEDSSTGYGSHMPNGSPKLPQPQIDAIRSWIARGAPKVESDGSARPNCSASPLEEE